jgi:hypothetical protein
MSWQNVEVVKRIYEELNSHRAFPPELFAPDCVTDLSEVSLDASPATPTEHKRSRPSA